MQDKMKKIFKGLGIVTGGVGAVKTINYSISKQLTAMALDRTEPKIMNGKKNKISGAKSTGTYQKIRNEKTGELQTGIYESVEITTYDDIRLTGYWKMCQEPERIIIAMHGWRSSWAVDFAFLSDYLYNNHCGVLYVDQRGQGQSDGECMGFGLLERYDCLEWIQWVNEQTGGNLPIYLLGVSMGATTVLMAAGNPLPENVKGIIADCGFTEPHQIWKHVVERNLHIPYRLHEKTIDKMCREKMKMDVTGYSTITAMKNCTVPVLFIHGTDDKFVPVEMSYENYKACKAPKRLLIVPGAGHGMSYYVNPEEYEKELKRFWEDFDENNAEKETVGEKM